ncbi:histidine kinase dimerization/phosphoacceptor domain -containing protein [Altibacter sp. HG106]|uniref:histidine kinase dimerization/phosphoacceptor domain -containing protein n=1 Tax=Altibacter sp. HG106 TaxID=3023937 RepID=UPI00235007BE|nr:histidine kinase dimerization/phosphoacceptor domain -containing protein [Altibacter sp. HG106]MDC7994724.1 histidine kinase dimerization/phosphoacceptor domain -containing protein [Altibacter sp. HG106]
MKHILALLLCALIYPVQAQHSKDAVAPRLQQLIDRAWEYTLESNDSSLLLSRQALDIAKENNDPLGQVMAMESIGLYHEIVTGNIEKASQFYFDAIALCEAEELAYIASVFHSLGIMFHTTDNYQNAKEYYLKSLEQAEKFKDSVLIKKCLINLGSVHSSLEDFASAENYMKHSLTLPVQPEMDYATLGNLGYLYVKQERFPEAISVLHRATEETPDNPDPDLNLYFLLHAKTQAKDSSNMNIPLARAKEAVRSGNYGLRDQSLLLRNIADYLAFTGNYQEALQYRDQYISVFEEIKEKQRDNVVLELETKYETEKKDAQLKLLALENQQAKQQRQRYLFLAIAGVVIAGLIGFFLFKNKRKNRQLARQKKLLEATIDEKNVLLKETHHRVKNSFQMVSSLLYLQAENVQDREGQLALQEAQNRVRSMVLIHQKLYSKEQLVGIDASEYIIDLITDILESHENEPASIEVSAEIAPLLLSVETITPLGLIINELLTNVVKHAFPKNQSVRTLEVRLKKNNQILLLTVRDNGLGMPSNIQESSFGIQLIRSLAKKLHGSLRYKPNEPQGTIAQLEIHRFEEL